MNKFMMPRGFVRNILPWGFEASVEEVTPTPLAQFACTWFDIGEWERKPIVEFFAASHETCKSSTIARLMAELLEAGGLQPSKTLTEMRHDAKTTTSFYIMLPDPDVDAVCNLTTRIFRGLRKNMLISVDAYLDLCELVRDFKIRVDNPAKAGRPPLTPIPLMARQLSEPKR